MISAGGLMSSVEDSRDGWNGVNVISDVGCSGDFTGRLSSYKCLLVSVWENISKRGKILLNVGKY